MHGKALSFDVSLKEPSLLDYLPNITETADVIDTYGKMQLMDRLIIHDGVAKARNRPLHSSTAWSPSTWRVRAPLISRAISSRIWAPNCNSASLPVRS
ncbi:hypothetical protein ABIC08_005480 [Bradyrhizobium sp. RT9b]